MITENELRTHVEKRYRTEFWGGKYLVSPRLIERTWGDGKALLGVQPLNTRPQYYVVRVDSAWLDTKYQFKSDEIYERIDEITDAIEEEFGRAWYDDDPPQRKSGRKWPAANFECGCCWFVVHEPKTPNME